MSSVKGAVFIDPELRMVLPTSIGEHEYLIITSNVPKNLNPKLQGPRGMGMGLVQAPTAKAPIGSGRFPRGGETCHPSESFP